MRPVPEMYRGLWRRRLLETAGQADRRTTVYWLQTASLYGNFPSMLIPWNPSPQK